MLFLITVSMRKELSNIVIQITKELYVVFIMMAVERYFLTLLTIIMTVMGSLGNAISVAMELYIVSMFKVIEPCVAVISTVMDLYVAAVYMAVEPIFSWAYKLGRSMTWFAPAPYYAELPGSDAIPDLELGPAELDSTPVARFYAELPGSTVFPVLELGPEKDPIPDLAPKEVPQEKTALDMDQPSAKNWLARKILRKTALSKKKSVLDISVGTVAAGLAVPRTLDDIVRLGGISVFALPRQFSPRALMIPTCLAATGNYVANNRAYHHLFT